MGPGSAARSSAASPRACSRTLGEWQARTLEPVYPILYLDTLIIKTRDGQAVRNFACYLAFGVNLEGERDVLEIWFQRTEGAKF